MALPLPSTRTILASLAAKSLPMAATAQSAGPEIYVYGQLNLGVINVGNAVASKTTFTDSDNSRIGLIVKQVLESGGAFRQHSETALGFTGSSSLGQGNDDFHVNYLRTGICKFKASYQTFDFDNSGSDLPDQDGTFCGRALAVPNRLGAGRNASPCKLNSKVAAIRGIGHIVKE